MNGLFYQLYLSVFTFLVLWLSRLFFQGVPEAVMIAVPFTTARYPTKCPIMKTFGAATVKRCRGGLLKPQLRQRETTYLAHAIVTIVHLLQ